MKQVRRRQLQALLDTFYKGDRAKLIRDSGLTHGRISQLLDPRQPFGEAAARNLVRALGPKIGLEDGYFERKDDAARPEPKRLALSPLALAVAERLDSFYAQDPLKYTTAYAVIVTELDRVERQWTQRAEQTAPEPRPKHARDR